MTTPKLFTPAQFGAISLANRVVMAPLTRNRARPADDVPSDLAAEYYAQRASAGLLITEASQIMPEGKGYAWTPGIYSPAQIEGWKNVTAAVHAKGGKIVLQMWHVGRISHTSLQPGGVAPVAPSAIAAKSQTFDGKGFVPTSEPRALALEEIPQIVATYAQAARNARAAGFDGVEIHAANGYLIDQFLRDGSNHRTDAYGGSIENRARFLFEVVEAVTAAIGADRTGIRLSPLSPSNGVTDTDPVAVFSHVITGLNRFNLAYLHMVEGATGGARDTESDAKMAALRALYTGNYIANNGYTRTAAMAAVDSGAADAIAFGKAFIANPDLVERLTLDAPLAEGDRATYYGGGAKGYTDYPTLAEAETA
ncbi:MAG: N-ethylmaleimide reductase [Rhodobacteraceae bacterium]|nr:N-ethylmaleimide reductase [Paracoccaceae bacterium]